MAQIRGERPVEQQAGKDRTQLYLAIGIGGIIAVLGTAFLISHAFAQGGTSSKVPAAAGIAQADAGGTPSGDPQVVRITVTPRGYQPSQPTVQSGRPVRLIIDGSQAPGCYAYIMSRSLGFNRELGPEPEIIDLPALQPGKYAFSCSMGMIRGSLNVQ